MVAASNASVTRNVRETRQHQRVRLTARVPCASPMLTAQRSQGWGSASQRSVVSLVQTIRTALGTRAAESARTPTSAKRLVAQHSTCASSARAIRIVPTPMPQSVRTTNASPARLMTTVGTSTARPTRRGARHSTCATREVASSVLDYKGRHVGRTFVTASRGAVRRFRRAPPARARLACRTPTAVPTHAVFNKPSGSKALVFSVFRSLMRRAVAIRTERSFCQLSRLQ